MRLFGRRGRGTDDATVADDVTDLEVGDDELDEVDADLDAEDDVDEDDDEDGYVEEGADRSEGPWDVAEQEGADGYVDLGALRLRGRDGMELRLELDESTGTVASATVHLHGSAVQLQAFAAPRTEGIWREIRQEIAEGIERQGGQVDEVPGTFGRELIARIPARTPDGRTGHTPARFVGVDGPRWFLRAVFHGEAVHRAEAAAELEEVVRDVVVVRGAEAMAPRELLSLRLPDQLAPEEAEPPAREELRPFERGPEITEVR